jgi:hypothetical protein
LRASVSRVEQSRANRVAARTAAERAALTFQDAVLAEFAVLGGHAGAGGRDRVVVLRGTVVLPPDADCEHDLGEELLEAIYAGSDGLLTLSATAGPGWLWSETVHLWDDLRQALMRCYCCQVPLSLVLDLDRRVVAGYEPFFCPDVGPIPDLLVDCASAADLDGDPFAALLDAVRQTDRDPEERLDALMDRFGLIPPTDPAHEPGECDFPQPPG